MLGYAGENERVLMASSSDDSDSDADFAMDPSDPRAHDKSHQPQLRVHPTRAPRRTKSRRAVAVGASVSRWDSESQASEGDEGEDEDEDVGERVPVQVVFAEGDADEDEEDEPLGGADDDEPTPEASPPQGEPGSQPPLPLSSVKLSKWALSRFLVPREERTIPVFEELPIEPLNDHILSDFSTRHRGTAGDVDVAKAIEDDESEDDEPDRLVVGAPLYVSADKSSGDAGRNGSAGDAKGAAKNADGDSKAPNRKRPESRYFVTDLATKCFNCGQIGHMSSLCMNDRVLKPCYYCGLRGHMAMACPHLPCPTCLQLGHTAKDCSNSPPKVDNCGVCGRTGHDDEDCELSDAGFRDISCMVCVKTGHLHCVPIPPPADRKFYCPNCAEKHLLNECSSYVEPSQPNYATSNFRMAMKCFVCQNPGHLAAECPQRSGQMNHFSCFKCGQRGHYASDCTSSSHSYNDNRQSGRKRGRDQYNSGNYDDDGDDDDDGNHYYQVPGGGNRGGNNSNRRVYTSSKSYSDSTVRLDSALPSYRNSGGYNTNNRNNNGYSNSGGYKNSSGNGDRRRGGNNGGRWR